MREFDFIVIGSGIAGLTFALKAAAKGSVALVTKRNLADSNTAWAQGGVACVVSEEDSNEAIAQVEAMAAEHSADVEIRQVAQLVEDEIFEGVCFPGGQCCIIANARG